VNHKIPQVGTPLLVFRSFLFHNASNKAKVGSIITISNLAAEFLGSAVLFSSAFGFGLPLQELLIGRYIS